MDGTTWICKEAGKYFPSYAQISNDRMLVASTCESPMLFQINTLNKNVKALIRLPIMSHINSMAKMKKTLWNHKYKIMETGNLSST